MLFCNGLLQRPLAVDYCFPEEIPKCGPYEGSFYPNCSHFRWVSYVWRCDLIKKRPDRLKTECDPAQRKKRPERLDYIDLETTPTVSMLFCEMTPHISNQDWLPFSFPTQILTRSMLRPVRIVWNSSENQYWIAYVLNLPSKQVNYDSTSYNWFARGTSHNLDSDLGRAIKIKLTTRWCHCTSKISKTVTGPYQERNPSRENDWIEAKKMIRVEMRQINLKWTQ